MGEFLLFSFTELYINPIVYKAGPKFIQLPLDEVSLLVKAGRVDPAQSLNGVNKPIWREEQDE